MKPNQAIVIGAGIAGIASALRLRHRGYEVRIFESNPYAGGKLHAFEIKGFRFDAGPSLFTMPQLVDELFELFGLDPRHYFPYIRKSSICNYFWDDGTRFNVPASTEKFAEIAQDTFDVLPHEISAYLRNSKLKYDLTGPVFLERSLHRVRSYFSLDVLRALFKMPSLDTLISLDKVNRKSFRDPRLVQLFNRYATYNGSSPYKTPGIMSMIPHLEMHQGTYLPERGMHDISQALYRLAIDQGVEFIFNRKVDRILVNDSKVRGVRAGGQDYEAQVVVSNMDIYHTYRSLMPDQKQPEAILKRERSGSALIFYWGMNRTFEELDLHNIFFSKDYESEFNHQFEKGSLADDLTVYVNITSKDIPSDAPPGCENWFVMVNAPSDTGQDWDALRMKAREIILQKLSKQLGVDLPACIIAEDILTPAMIESRTSSYRGSLYGTSSNSTFAAFFRHPNFSSRIKNLLFCGGSVHPGGGIPLCLMSAKIVADQIPVVR